MISFQLLVLQILIDLIDFLSAYDIKSSKNPDLTMNPDEIAAYKEIDDIVWRLWDPIGVNDFEDARDEYDRYLPKLLELKIHRRSVEEISEYLLNIEVLQMGLPGNPERCRYVANKIVYIQL